MIYLVREPLKTGGTKFHDADAAVAHALMWHAETGIACEIWAVPTYGPDFKVVPAPDLIELTRRNLKQAELVN